MEKKAVVLVTGSNVSIIDDIFDHLDNTFTLIGARNERKDIIRQAYRNKPDAIIVCVDFQSKEAYLAINDIRDKEAYENIPVLIIGILEDCNRFNRNIGLRKTRSLVRPVGMDEIKDNLIELTSEKTKIVKIKDNKRKHILIIDDDIRMLKVLREILSEEYDVGVSPNGSLALKFLEAHKTDLILLDYIMDGLDGPDVLAVIRGIEEYKNLPVVFLTGVTDKDKIVRGLKYQPQGYLLKPVDKNTLINKIKELIG